MTSTASQPGKRARRIQNWRRRFSVRCSFARRRRPNALQPAAPAAKRRPRPPISKSLVVSDSKGARGGRGEMGARIGDVGGIMGALNGGGAREGRGRGGNWGGGPSRSRRRRPPPRQQPRAGAPTAAGWSSGRSFRLPLHRQCCYGEKGIAVFAGHRAGEHRPGRSLCRLTAE